MTSLSLPALLSLGGLGLTFLGLVVAVIKLYTERAKDAREKGARQAKDAREEGARDERLKRVVEDVAGLSSDLKEIWEFIRRRGQVEAAQKGWGQFQSPFQITELAIEAITPFLAVFLPWYTALREDHPDLTDGQVIARLEAQFGDYIVEKLCAPYGVAEGACLVSILDVCKHFHGRPTNAGHQT